MSASKAGLLAALIVVASPVAAQDVVYRPISPTFGGNPFNSNHVLGVANANNDTRDPRSRTTNSQADIFARQLQSRLLSSLSSQLVNAIFGDNPQEQGRVSFGGQTIEFFRSLDEVTLIIRNDETGEETRIVVPLFVDVE
ncbi:curli assembly protein CsgF [Erythrobacter dokdonensis]|uniref:Curli production assembly/transport component CsgF n=1 Tax=Erythrobacter dokdonensis DSW-74 TaxID=1300349 RepID=A0A1A7BEN5_9SPHN|nr:curli assembly protein CsgF [Erythrobacter dokdonensis]OBV10216.1 Curli production assembly/transport component CsgF [Erythrobacter dokdonensis DSW-74]